MGQARRAAMAGARKRASRVRCPRPRRRRGVENSPARSAWRRRRRRPSRKRRRTTQPAAGATRGPSAVRAAAHSPGHETRRASRRPRPRARRDRPDLWRAPLRPPRRGIRATSRAARERSRARTTPSAAVTASASTMSTRAVVAETKNVTLEPRTTAATMPAALPKRLRPSHAVRASVAAAASTEGRRAASSVTPRVPTDATAPSQWNSGGFDGISLPLRSGRT